MRRATRSRQTSVLSDQSTISKKSMEFDNDENVDSTFSSNASSIRAKRGPKRTATIDVPPTVEEEEEEAEKNVKVKVEKEEKLSIVEMVNRICEGAKGENKIVKTLLAMKEKFTDHAEKNMMRRILWTTKLADSQDGRKLQLLMIFEIGVAPAFLLIRKRVAKEDFKPADAKNYGHLLLAAYRVAIARDKDAGRWENGEGPLTKEVIEGCEHLASAAICITGFIGEKFMGMLQTAVEVPDRVKYDALIHDCLEPHLWRNLNAPHDMIRFNASRILLRFYPLTNNNIEQQNTIEKQWEFMITMLSDECVEIRREAAFRIQKQLAAYYSIVPLHVISKIAKHIATVSSFDSIPAVRVAVLEGFTQLIPISEAINVTENGLKTMLPRLVEDRSEKVRLTAVRLLQRLRGHRLIKYFDVVPMEAIMARLECECSDAVRREIVQLVYTSFLPQKASADERNTRIVRLVRFGRVAALTFHRLIVPMGLASIEDAVAHLKNVCIAVYKNWRKGVPENGDMASVEAGGADTTLNLDTSMISNSSMDTSAMSISSIDEDAFVFRRDKTLLECSVVLWASIAKELKKPQHDANRKMVDKLMSKIFKKMFVSFRQTSLLGTVMCIGSLLPSAMLEEYSIQILSILKEKSVDDEILEPYLAAGASWRIEELMQIVKDGLYELPSVLPGLSFTASASPQKKRPRKSKLSPVERIRQALHYLKYSLSSEPISSKLLSDCKQQLIECFEALSHVHSVVDAYLDSLEDEDGDEELKALTGEDMLSLYESATVLAVLMMEMPTTSSSSSTAPTTRSSRAGSVGSGGVAASAEGATTDAEEDDGPSASPYSLFFFVSLHWIECSLITRIGRCHSIERNKDMLLMRLAKVTLQHAETVLSACPRPPRPPTHAAMADAMRRLTPPVGAASSEEEEEAVGDATSRRRSSIGSIAARRRSSLASTVASMGVESVGGPPQKSYLERLSAMLAALLHSSTPVVLLKATLRLHEIIMGMDCEEGEDARADGKEVMRAAIAITKRAAEMPYEGEQLRASHIDAVLAFTKVAIAKYPDGPAAFDYQVVSQVRANCQRLLMQAIEERGIEDVTDHTYDLHEYIQLLLHRFVFRHETIYREFRKHVERFTINFEPGTTEFVEDEEAEREEEEQVDDNGDVVQKESQEDRKERLEGERKSDYMRFVIGCMLLRLSAPEIRTSIIKEKRNDKARRSMQVDINTVALYRRLEEWKQAMRMDDGTETILREMIGPK